VRWRTYFEINHENGYRENSARLICSHENSARPICFGYQHNIQECYGFQHIWICIVHGCPGAVRRHTPI
jgi:hypothetical protein